MARYPHNPTPEARPSSSVYLILPTRTHQGSPRSNYARRFEIGGVEMPGFNRLVSRYGSAEPIVP